MTQEYYPYIKDFFRRWARVYNVAVWPISGIRKKVVKMTGAKKGDKVLDVCTGTGKQAFAFAEKGCDVTGIDLSEEMLAVARKNNKYPNLKLEAGDATRLPYADASFDIASVSIALHDMPPEIWQKVVHEMARVIQPGGTFVVMDYKLPGFKLYRFFVAGFIKLYESKYWAEFVKTDLRAVLREAGFIIEAEKPVALHAARIWKGKRGK